MAYFSHTKAFDELKKATSGAIKGYFPVVGKRQTLKLHDVWIDDNLDADDLSDQKDAKEKGKTWSVPVKAKLELVDNQTGKTVDTRTLTVANLPKMTPRYSFIVDGNEKQVQNQLRLKSGVYARVAGDGDLESLWNLEKGLAREGRGATRLSTYFEPKNRKMVFRYESANIPVYPILKLLDVPDKAIEKAWGKEIFEANRKISESEVENNLRKLHRSITDDKVKVDDIKEVRRQLLESFQGTKLRPDSVVHTLGKPFTTMNGESLLAGTEKLLKVSRGDVPPDDRDSLLFKDVYSAEDLVKERLVKDNQREILRKLMTRVDRGKDLREVVSSETFGNSIHNFFKNSSITERPSQQNPLNIMGGIRTTTIGGEHGIQGENKIKVPSQSINASHIGFLDPIQTPENQQLGTILQLSLATKKEGKDLLTRVFNTKTGKTEYIKPDVALKSVVAFPDQYRWEGGKPTPRGQDVQVTDQNGDITVAKPHEVQYIYKSTKGMFDFAANLIPFLQSNHGNRSMVAAKQLEQALALVHREAPLVQSKGEGEVGQVTGSNKPQIHETFEQLVGSLHSHSARVDGTVTRVGKDAIHIKAADGTTHKVHLYDDFPLNENKSLLNSTPLVKTGDQVKAGQIVADTNFTRNGQLAIGTNLRVAYMPFKGYNFEDGIVISESAAQKLKSEHMLRHSISVDSTDPKDARTILNKTKFVAETAGKYTREQADKLDDRAIIKPGVTVTKGDVLIGALKKEDFSPEQQQLARFSKSLVRPVREAAVHWDKDYPGVIAKVVTHGKDTTVYVKTQTPAEIGDKLAGRHGNKGIITMVLPDHQMPKTKEGEHMEILLNPTGVPTRMNVGQVLETAAAKIARKTGKPYVVNNFDPDNKDYTRNLLQELEHHGISDTETLFDAQTGRPSRAVLTGEQYFLKLHHTAEKGITARSAGVGNPYDLNYQPKKGDKHSAQSMDVSGLYALLAHGARENVREMQTIKSDRNDDYWALLQAGEAPPAPRVPFAYKKFTDYLTAMGIDHSKHGNRLQLAPLTDKQVLAMSKGELKNPDLSIRSKDLRPEPGSIFDPEITGTKWPKGEYGRNWSHITLASRMPNPTFAGPICTLLGLTNAQLENTIAGKHTLDGRTGPDAVVHALSQIDPKQKMKELEDLIPKTRKDKLSKVTRQIRYLRALEKVNLKPHEAYTMQHVAVIPPVMRPVSVMDNGSLSTDDLNDLYMGIGKVNKKLKSFDYSKFPEEEAHELKSALYDGLESLMLTGGTFRSRHKKGIGEIIGGGENKKSKEAFFQGKIIGKRQDLSMRGVIVPEPSMGLDEIKIPEKAARELYKPFVIRRMVFGGSRPSEAIQKYRQNHPDAKQALLEEVKSRPIFLKRDPVLHKYGVQAFMPKLDSGQVVKIHPLVTAGYNADFDGDKMGAFLPISQKAIDEAFATLPSKNLFSPSNGKLMYVPSQESMFGLYRLSKFNRDRSKEARFKNEEEARRAMAAGKIAADDIIHIEGEVHPKFEHGGHVKTSAQTGTTTTLGRILIYQHIPEENRDPKMLTDPNFKLDKPTLSKVLENIAKSSPQEFAHSADKLKTLGNNTATGLSFSLHDLVSDHEHRDHVLAEAKEAERKVRSKEKNHAKRDAEVVRIYSEAADKIQSVAKKRADQDPNRMYEWVHSGARGDWSQYSQMTVAPMLVVDSVGKTIPVPITRSYSEGLNIGSYWASLHGARMGAIGRQVSTAKPGALTKEMMQSSIGQLVTTTDCKTTKGISLPIDDKSALDRYTAEEISLGNRGGKEKGRIPAGTLITPEVIARLQNNKVKDVVVRTPLRCAEAQGICSTCYGLNQNGDLHPKGTNVGILAAHSLGEPLTQLAMNAFHTGGVAGSVGARAANKFERVDQLLHLPKRLPGSAILSTVNGAVQGIEQDKATGGWHVSVAGEKHFIPAMKGAPIVKVGDEVSRGDAISEGPKNPRELLDLTNMGKVQGYLVDELEHVYGGKSAVHRRNAEVFVRAMTNLSEIKDPGDHPDYLPEDHIPTTEIVHFNAHLPEGKRPIVHKPILNGIGSLPKEIQEDWLALLQSKSLKRTITDAAAEGWHSDIHNVHPIPGMAYGMEFGQGTPKSPWMY